MRFPLAGRSRADAGIRNEGELLTEGEMDPGSPFRAKCMLFESDRVFLDAEQREVGGRANGADAVSRFDADHQDSDDLECMFAVPRDSHLIAAHVSDVHERAGGGIFLLGIHEPDGGFCIAREHGGEAFHLLLPVADEGGADFMEQQVEKIPSSVGIFRCFTYKYRHRR
jgi:hypothetical protein